MNDTLGPEYYSSSDSGLVTYWRFDEGSGQTANDKTINGNHGTLGSTTGTDSDDPSWVVSDAPVPVELALFKAWLLERMFI